MKDLLYQCYFINNDGKRCEMPWMDIVGLETWCSPEHKHAWQKETYSAKDSNGRRHLTVKEMQKRCVELGKLATVNEKTNINGQIQILPNKELAYQESIQLTLDH